MRHSRGLALIVGHHHCQFVLTSAENNEHLDIRIENVEESVVGRGKNTCEYEIGQQRDDLCQHIAAHQRRRLAYYALPFHISPWYFLSTHSAPNNRTIKSSTHGKLSNSEKRVWV